MNEIGPNPDFEYKARDLFVYRAQAFLATSTAGRGKGVLGRRFESQQGYNLIT